MYAPPPAPQIENLVQAQSAVMPYVHRVRAPSPWLGLKLGLVAACAIVLVLALSRR
jgi:hypothetical protein